MKKMALLAAAAVAVMATPAMAGGYVGAVYGNTDVDGSDADTWQVEGAFGHNGGSWGLQGDASVGNTDVTGSDADHHTIAGHLYWQGSGWRLGGVLASANLDDSGTEVEELVYGVEGTFDFGPSTVANASYTFGEIEIFGSDVDTWNIDGGLNFYSGDNFRFGGTLGVGNLEAPGVDADTFTAGVNAEWAPLQAPVSFTFGYNHFDVDNAFLGGLETDSFSIGARWNFGGTLRERDNATPFDTRTGLYPRALDLR